MITNTEVLTLLGITAPTNAQLAQMAFVCAGVEADLKAACNWQLDETGITEYLPHPGAFYDNRVGTAAMTQSPRRTSHRLQLGSMYVTAVDSVHENPDAIGGEGPSDFGSDHLLEAGAEYFLDKDEAKDDVSWSGAIMRVDRTWSSAPRSIQVVYTSGFAAPDYAEGGVARALKDFAVNKAIDRYMSLHQRIASINSGSSGVLSSERLGDYAVSHRNPLDKSGSAPDNGMTDADMDFLFRGRFVYLGVGV